MNSTNDILSIKGVGEKTARLFRKIGIDTVEDLIHDLSKKSGTQEIESCAEWRNDCGIFAITGNLFI